MLANYQSTYLAAVSEAWSVELPRHHMLTTLATLSQHTTVQMRAQPAVSTKLTCEISNTSSTFAFTFWRTVSSKPWLFVLPWLSRLHCPFSTAACSGAMGSVLQLVVRNTQAHCCSSCCAPNQSSKSQKHYKKCSSAGCPSRSLPRSSHLR